jgi:hypothetical protein
VTVGTSRIFTFKGGNEIIWSTTGNIAAGSASKTLQSAPPARYQIDPETGSSILDLAGLATGGGIGVLQTLQDVPAGNIDLIAPTGIVDAGDAGIRSSGNLNIAALQILNAFNIQVQGQTTGVPVVQPPNISALAAAGNTAGSSTRTEAPTNSIGADRPSIIIVEVLGYGGGDGSDPAKQDDQRQGGATEQRSSNSNGAYQVLGAGAISADEARQIIAERRQRAAR